MATATRGTKTVTVTTEVPDGVVLTLTDKEAQTLTDILSRIGGNLDTRRGVAQHIFDTLHDSGFIAGENCDIDPLRRAIYFI